RGRRRQRSGAGRVRARRDRRRSARGTAPAGGGGGVREVLGSAPGRDRGEEHRAQEGLIACSPSDADVQPDRERIVRPAARAFRARAPRIRRGGVAALMGVLAMAVYKAVSNQKSLARVKSQISMRLLEIRLFSHDILQVLRSTGMIVVKNFIYLGNHMLPMVIMFGPFVVILAQLVANYAYDPAPP